MKRIIALLAFALAMTPMAANAARPQVELLRAVDTGCGQSSWTTTNSTGVPLPMTFNGWGDCASAPGAFQGFDKWSYVDYPIQCLPAPEIQPAYQFLYITNAGNPKTPLVDTNLPAMRNQIQRAVSVFAASENRGVTTINQLRALHTPRIITDSNCRPTFTKVTVPAAVMNRAPYINWTNPSTGQLEQGLWPYLETHGFPATDLRRYIAVTDTPVGGFSGGQTQTPYAGGDGYNIPPDNQPGVMNKNNAGGYWMLIALSGNTQIDLSSSNTNSFGLILAHEFAHGMGAVLSDSVNYNSVAGADFPHHPKDCADILCYNYREDMPGQTYTACGPATVNTYQNYVSSGAQYSRPAYRLDCNRNDYFGYYLDGSGNVQEKSWTSTRWAGENNRFFGGPGGFSGFVWNNQNWNIHP